MLKYAHRNSIFSVWKLPPQPLASSSLPPAHAQARLSILAAIHLMTPADVFFARHHAHSATNWPSHSRLPIVFTAGH